MLGFGLTKPRSDIASQSYFMQFRRKLPFSMYHTCEVITRRLVCLLCKQAYLNRQMTAFTATSWNIQMVSQHQTECILLLACDHCASFVRPIDIIFTNAHSPYRYVDVQISARLVCPHRQNFFSVFLCIQQQTLSSFLTILNDFST